MTDIMQDFGSMFDDITPNNSQIPHGNMMGQAAEVKEEIPFEADTVKVAPVQTPVQNTQSVQAVQPRQTQQVVTKGVTDDFEIDLPDELKSQMAEIGVEMADIGVKISSVPIEKYRASQAKIDRISFITKKVIPVKYHYFDGVGSILCNRGKCCEMGGNPTIRYLFPIVVYTTDSDGNLSGGNVALKILSASSDLYKSITTINNGCKSMGGIDHIDMLVTCTDDKYQKMTLVQAGPAVWRQYPQIVQYLRDKWTQDGANSYMAVARKVDEETLMRLLKMNGSDDVGSNQNETMSPQDLSKYFN